MSHKKEVLWRKNKYEVMSHSQNAYREIQKSISNLSYEELNGLIIEAKKVDKTKGSITNTYQHIWGYFKKQATDKEKQQTFVLLENFTKNKVAEEVLWTWLAKLTVKYNQTYLLESTIIRKYIN